MNKGGPGILGISRQLLLDRNVRAIALTGLIAGVYLGMINTVLQRFTLSLGLTIASLGILQAFGNRFSGLVASVTQPFAGHYADVNGRKVIITLGSVATIVSMLSFLTAALTHSLVALVIAFVLFGTSVLGSPASQAIVAESVNMDPRKMDIAFSAVFLLSSIPGAVMSFAAGPIADGFGYYVIFVVASILELVNLYLYLDQIVEPTLRLTAEGLGLSRNAFSFRSAISLPRAYLGYFATFAMDSFSFGISSTIILGMLFDRFGYSNTDLGLIVGTLSVAIIVAQYPATRLLLLVGPKRSLAISELLGVALMLGWALAGSLPVFILLSVVFGASIATWVPAQQSMLMTHSPPGERGSTGGKLAAFRGLVAFPAPIIGGFLYQSFGFRAPLLASLAGTIVTTWMIVKFLPERSVRAD